MICIPNLLDSFSHAFLCPCIKVCLSLRFVSVWLWMWVGSCSAGPQGDKDVISSYLWLVKWKSLGPACPPYPLSFPTCDGPHKSSSILLLTGILFKDNATSVCLFSPPLVCTCDTQARALQNPPRHNYPSASLAQHKQWEVNPTRWCSFLRLNTCSTHVQGTICKSAITSLLKTERWVTPAEPITRWLYRGITQY